MSPSSFVQCAGALAALAMFSGCSDGNAGSTASVSTSFANVQYKNGLAFVNGRPVTAARPNAGALTRYPTVPLAPDAKSKTKYFDYIINDYGSYASIFNYPTGTKQIGTIEDGVGGQGCTNVLNGYGKKIVWIVAAYNQISEYAVPKRLMKSLSISDGTMPSSCAMNTDGDLAVGLLDGASEGDIVIFKKAKGAGTFVKTPLTEEFFDGYDNKGNLFFDGYNGSFVPQFAELPKGSSTAVTITTSNTLEFPGSVQWDGKYVTVLDQVANKLYRYTIAGTKATLKDTISLTGSSDCAQTWIAASVLYCGDAGLDGGEVFKYPAGGSPIATLTGDFDLPLGTTAATK
jgi:hypothetical protein